MENFYLEDFLEGFLDDGPGGGVVGGENGDDGVQDVKRKVEVGVRNCLSEQQN